MIPTPGKPPRNDMVIKMKPKANRKGRIGSNYQNEAQTVGLIDELAEFEEFKLSILKKLRRALVAGAKAEEIFMLVQAEAAARMATFALTELEPVKAMAAIKDILDRTQGKAIERKHITATYEDTSDEELDRLLKNEEEELAVIKEIAH